MVVKDHTMVSTRPMHSKL